MESQRGDTIHNTLKSGAGRFYLRCGAFCRLYIRLLCPGELSGHSDRQLFFFFFSLSDSGLSSSGRLFVSGYISFVMERYRRIGGLHGVREGYSGFGGLNTHTHTHITHTQECFLSRCFVRGRGRGHGMCRYFNSIVFCRSCHREVQAIRRIRGRGLGNLSTTQHRRATRRHIRTELTSSLHTHCLDLLVIDFGNK